MRCKMLVWLSVVVVGSTAAYDWDSLKLPDEHIPYYFTNNPSLRELCKTEPNCPYKAHTSSEKCWGYEENCAEEKRMFSPICPGDDRGWVRRDKRGQKGDKTVQINLFWTGGDFGYIKEKKNEMTTICEPIEEGDSKLECVSHTRHCKADNIYLDFRSLKSKGSRERFRDRVFGHGDLGGKCKMDHDKFLTFGQHKSPLQSWYAELENFTGLDFNPMTEKGKCDITLDKPTIFMKLDAGINMYHHFCDYVNLYMAQHFNNSFTTDVKIIMWDTSSFNYGDYFSATWRAFTQHPIVHLRDYEGKRSEMNYGDFFARTWDAFTDYPITHLKEFDGKRVCVKDALFPFLPRMRYGQYYNMPLVPGCEQSSMYRAFSQHVLHRLGITQTGPLKKKLRVTLLDRKTKYRMILNQDEIIRELRKDPDYEVRVVKYNYEMPFEEQLQLTHNTDIFMGMHGAGLTHLLFLPDWATICEIYNCDDEHCYKDLARLRGVNYMTWQDPSKLEQQDEGHHPTLGAHKKFTNYSFDVETFLGMLKQAKENVRSNAWYKKAWAEKWGAERTEL